MSVNKTSSLPYTRPEEQIIARIITQALEDVEHLPMITSDGVFRNTRNELWAFFHSDWFYNILDYLEIDTDKPLWEETRKKIWNCRTHRTYIRPDRKKKEEKDGTV